MKSSAVTENETERKRKRSQNAPEREWPTFIQLSVGLILASSFLCRTRALQKHLQHSTPIICAHTNKTHQVQKELPTKRTKKNQNNNIKTQFHNFRENCDTVCCAAHSR